MIAEARLALTLSASLAEDPDAERTSEAKLIGLRASQPPSSASPESATIGTDWLLRSVTHDLNNMLLVIQNCSQAMKRHPALLPREVGVVEDAVTQAARLVAKLLPPEAKLGRPAGTDMSQIILRFSGVIRSLVGERVAVVTRLASGLPLAQCEESALARVLANLATNARDAMPEGGTLTLETREQAESAPNAAPGASDRYLVLTVTDTGVGMDDATQGRAFDPFFTTKPTGRGTGVGLTTVREIVRASGGFLELESSVGSGTTVRVFLRSLPSAG